MPADKEEGEKVVECHLVPKPSVISWMDEIEGFYETEAYSG